MFFVDRIKNPTFKEVADWRNTKIIDSRKIGSINKKYFTGKAIARVFPFTSFEIFTNSFN